MRLFRLSRIIFLSLAALALAGCATTQREPERPPPPQILPPAFPPQDIVGRWGLAAFHKPEDRERTEAAAANQCRQPYVISLGPTGGVMMHLADQAQPEELRLRGAANGKTYIGPEGEPGGAQDREVESFNGRVLILRFVDPEVHGRYGSMVYVRCGPEGEKRKPVRARPKPPARPKPAPPPAGAPAPPTAPR